MADTSKTLNTMTDIELRQMIGRLRMEQEALRALSNIKCKTDENVTGPVAVSSETIVYEGKTIKGMTDKELNLFLGRLKNQEELIYIIKNIQALNDPTKRDQYGDCYADGIVDPNTPLTDLYHDDRADDVLAHFGIPGMHWGSRKSSGSRPKGSQDYLQSRELKKKGIKNLSTAELKTLNARRQQEAQYKSLNPSIVKKGMSAGKVVLASMATITAVYAFGKSAPGEKIIEKTGQIVSKLAFMGK